MQGTHLALETKQVEFFYGHDLKLRGTSEEFG